MDELVAADYVAHDAGGSVEGRDGFRQYAAEYRTAIEVQP